MRAAIKNDLVRRTITIEVQDVPDIDITSYHRTPRIIRPDSLKVELVDGQVSTVTASGGLVRKSGQASEAVRDGRTWYRTDLTTPGVPDWVLTLVTDAPAGVTSWRTGEVQAL